MKISTEYLTVRMFQSDLIFGKLYIEILKDVVSYLLPVK